MIGIHTVWFISMIYCQCHLIKDVSTAILWYSLFSHWEHGFKIGSAFQYNNADNLFVLRQKSNSDYFFFFFCLFGFADGIMHNAAWVLQPWEKSPYRKNAIPLYWCSSCLIDSYFPTIVFLILGSFWVFDEPTGVDRKSSKPDNGVN